MSTDHAVRPERAAAQQDWPEPVRRTVRFFESITPESVAAIDAIYAPGAWFKDPFNEIEGVEAIRRVFGHMFEQVAEPRFEIVDVIGDRAQAFLSWDFSFRFRRGGRGERQCIHGATHLRFGVDGRIVYHRDYWDAAEELYEKLPLIGAAMRWMRRRVAHGG